MSNKYDAIVPLRLPCGEAVGDTTNRAVASSLVTRHDSYLRSLRGCWIVEALKASGVALSNLLPRMFAYRFTHAFWYLRKSGCLYFLLGVVRIFSKFGAGCIFFQYLITNLLSMVRARVVCVFLQWWWLLLIICGGKSVA